MHIVLGLRIGGLERFVLDLTASGSSVAESMILCLDDPMPDPDIDKDFTIVRWEKPAGLLPTLGLRIASLVRQHQIDLIHTHNPAPHLYGALAAAITRTPLIHTKHGRNYPGDPRKVWLNRVASLLSRYVVAVSSDATRVCRDIERIPAAKLKTILNGIDTSSYIADADAKDAFRRELGVDEETMLIGIVARLSPEKNHELLLSACRILKAREVKFQLVVIGDGPLGNELSISASAKGLSDSVRFLGARNDVASLLPGLDVFALSSTTEGISLTLLEAMSCEIPVVATAVGGNPEVVDDGVTGYLVQLDPNSMATALQRFSRAQAIDSSYPGLHMGKAARERVIERFSLERAVSEYHALYRAALNVSS